MNKFFKILSLLTTALFAFVGIADASCLGAEGVVVTNDSAHVGGEPITTDVTNEYSSELLRKAIDKKIVEIRPNMHPIEQIARLGGRKVKADSMIFEWYSVDTKPISGKLTAAYTQVTTSQTATISVESPEQYDVTDTIIVPSVTGYDENGNAETKALMLYVQAVTSTGITVQAINGGLVDGTTASDNKRYVPSIPDATVIYRLGRAGAELDMRTPSYGVLPKKSQNYCQIFMSEIAQSTIQKMSAKEVEWDFSDLDRANLFNMLLTMEGSFKFGRKGKTYDTLKKAEFYTTNGIVNQITKSITIPAKTALTNDKLIDVCKSIFAGTNGSEKRVMLMGSDFNAFLSKNDSIQKQIDAGNTVEVFGIEWKEIRSNFGTILALQDDSLDLYGYSDKAILIDPNNFVKAEFMPLEKTVLDLKTAGVMRGDVQELVEISCVCIQNPDCHAILTLDASI